jgi:hypothetical protein
MCKCPAGSCVLSKPSYLNNNQEIALDINWTTIISTAVTTAINSATMFLTMRYLGKLTDKLESKNGKAEKDNS